MALLDVRLDKRLGELRLHVDLAFEAGVTAIVGPSGSGKTTLLRCVAGLERPDAGRITFSDEPWLSESTCVPVQERRVGFVFSDYALFPHLTVRRNVAFGARRPAAVEESLMRLGILGLADRHPQSLSAGEQQRAAIARALAAEPRLLLMDEPFSSLDPHLKARVYAEFATLQEELGLPVLLVTHDLSEACQLASRVVVLDAGSVLQAGTPRDILYHPAGPTVAQLAGISNVFEGAIAPGGRLCWGTELLEMAPVPLLPGSTVAWCIRAEQVELAPGGGANVVTAVLSSKALTGHGYRLTGVVEGCDTLQAVVPLSEAERLQVGDTVKLWLPPQAIHIMAEGTSSLAARGL